MNIQQKFLEDPQQFLNLIEEIKVDDLRESINEIEQMIQYLNDYDICIEQIDKRIFEIGMEFGLLDVSIIDNDLSSDLKMYAIYTLVYERLRIKEEIPYAVVEDESILEFSNELANKYKVRPVIGV